MTESHVHSETVEGADYFWNGFSDWSYIGILLKVWLKEKERGEIERKGIESELLRYMHTKICNELIYSKEHSYIIGGFNPFAFFDNEIVLSDQISFIECKNHPSWNSMLGSSLLLSDFSSFGANYRRLSSILISRHA